MTTVVSNVPIDPKAIQQLAISGVTKLNKIKTELNQVVLERESEIASAIRALAAGEHLLLIGPAGAAKTFLATCLGKHVINCKLFYWLMNRTTDPAALLGPFNIKAMEQGRFTRNWQNMLPDSDIGILDEIYKSNEPVLNILLSVLNEGIFHDDGKAIPVRLRTVVGCSNEGPEDDSLIPLHDRLLFRHLVKPIQEPTNRVKMMKLDVDRRANHGGKYVPNTTVTLEELNAISTASCWVKVPESVYTALNKLDISLEKKGIRITDRRKTARMKILQTEALLNGRWNTSAADLEALTYIYWDREEDIKEIETEIGKLINPYDQKYRELMTRAEQVHKATIAITTFAEKAKAAIEAKSSLDNILEKLLKLSKDMTKEGYDITKVQKAIANVEKFRNQIITECLGLNQPASGASPVVDDPFGFSGNGSPTPDDTEMPF